MHCVFIEIGYERLCAVSCSKSRSVARSCRAVVRLFVKERRSVSWRRRVEERTYGPCGLDDRLLAGGEWVLSP
jgi:hypothetical protein